MHDTTEHPEATLARQRPALNMTTLRRYRAAALGTALAAALAGAAIAHFAWDTSSAGSVSASTGSSQGSARSSVRVTSTSLSAVSAKVDTGPVDINTRLGDEGTAAGTGMIVSSSGEVITNNHVIDGATSITATDVATGTTYKARVVGYDSSKDIAVIQLIGAKSLNTVTLGDSSTVRRGQSVITIGNAGGVGGTPSAATGTVTALSRSITASDGVSGNSERLNGLIELDGSLEAGDSGGPLVNSSGEVVGMDTAASSGFSFRTSSSADFAIPINEVLAIAQRIERGDASTTIHIGATALIGVEIAAAESSPAGYGYGSASTIEGAAVAGVEAGSPAAAAGLVAGDTITALGGHTVDSASALTTIKNAYRPGQRVSVAWADSSGTTHTATITLAVGPAA
ncbi:MAG TPA: trypsin-like peptidase domain-containing protein [Solirubrobacteraceae bacterium]|jgi:S1-C subfamily serine protease